MAESIANIEVDENKFNSTNHTDNLNLPQFIATDKPGWLTDFNGAMEVIDEAAGVLQAQITEQFEDLESVHTQLDRVDNDINDPETGVRQVLHDTQTRVTDLETTVGDESHGLVKDVADLQEDMVQTNTMAVKSNAQLGSIINLLCNKYSTAAQYSQGAYVYTENEDGSLNFLRCTETTHGAFNPDKWEDVTEKLISALDNSGGGGGSQYVLPVAGDADDPDAVLGGVIVGEGLSIDPDTGILSRTITPTEGIGPDYYASSVRAGLVRPNGEAGLYVNSANGLLSVILDDSTMEFTSDGKIRAKADTSRFAQGQGVSISNENVPTISVRLAAENSNLGFDGNGGLRAILPSSAYTIVQGEGIDITTDAQTNEKTISLVQASTNTLGGVRPKSDSFAFESYDPNDQSKKKMTIQLKDKGGLQKADGVGLSVKVDNDTVVIDPVTGELKANGGGGGGYTLPIASANTLGGIKVGSGLSIDPATGVLDATGSGSGLTPISPNSLPGVYDSTTETVNISNTYSQYENFGQFICNKSVTLHLERAFTNPYTSEQETFAGDYPIYAGVLYKIKFAVVTEDDGESYHYESVDWERIYRDASIEDIKGEVKSKSVQVSKTNTDLLAGTTYNGLIGAYFITDSAAWNRTQGSYTFINPNLGNGVNDSIPLYITLSGSDVLLTKLVVGVTYTKGAVLSDYSVIGLKRRTISPSIEETIPQISDPSEIYNNVTNMLGEKANVLHYMRSADPSNVTYTGNKFIPVKGILENNGISNGDLVPIASTVAGETPYIQLPVSGGNPVRNPYLFLFPLDIRFKAINSDTPSSWDLIGKSFNGKLCTLIYYVDAEQGVHGEQLNFSLNRVPLFTKRITIGKNHLNGRTANELIPIEEKIGYEYDGTTSDEYGNRYGAVIVYPQGATHLAVHAQLEVLDLSDGTVERYFSTVYSSSSSDEPDNPFEIYGATYLYDLSKTTYTDSEVYAGV